MNLHWLGIAGRRVCGKPATSREAAIDTLPSPRVFAGLDPAIHDEVQRVISVHAQPLHGLMDARVKPAHDAEFVGSLQHHERPRLIRCPLRALLPGVSRP